MDLNLSVVWPASAPLDEELYRDLEARLLKLSHEEGHNVVPRHGETARGLDWVTLIEVLRVGAPVLGFVLQAVRIAIEAQRCRQGLAAYRAVLTYGKGPIRRVEITDGVTDELITEIVQWTKNATPDEPREATVEIVL